MLLSQYSYIYFLKCSLFMTILLLLQVAQNWPFRIVDSAFSKRFVGAGHSVEGGGPGGEGTLPSARRACTSRGVWGHSPSEIF